MLSFWSQNVISIIFNWNFWARTFFGGSDPFFTQCVLCCFVFRLVVVYPRLVATFHIIQIRSSCFHFVNIKHKICTHYALCSSVSECGIHRAQTLNSLNFSVNKTCVVFGTICRIRVNSCSINRKSSPHDAGSSVREYFCQLRGWCTRPILQFCTRPTLFQKCVVPSKHRRTSESIITIHSLQDFTYLICSFTASSIMFDDLILFLSIFLVRFHFLYRQRSTQHYANYYNFSSNHTIYTNFSPYYFL